MTKHVKAGRTAKKLVGTLALLVSFGLAATGCTSGSEPSPTAGVANAGTPQSEGSLTVLLDGGFSGGYATGLDPATSNTVGANSSQMASRLPACCQ